MRTDRYNQHCRRSEVGRSHLHSNRPHHRVVIAQTPWVPRLAEHIRQATTTQLDFVKWPRLTQYIFEIKACQTPPRASSEHAVEHVLQSEACQVKSGGNPRRPGFGRK